MARKSKFASMLSRQTRESDRIIKGTFALLGFGTMLAGSAVKKSVKQNNTNSVALQQRIERLESEYCIVISNIRKYLYAENSKYSLHIKIVVNRIDKLVENSTYHRCGKDVFWSSIIKELECKITTTKTQKIKDEYNTAITVCEKLKSGCTIANILSYHIYDSNKADAQLKRVRAFTQQSINLQGISEIVSNISISLSKYICSFYSLNEMTDDVFEYIEEKCRDKIAQTKESTRKNSVVKLNKLTIAVVCMLRDNVDIDEIYQKLLSDEIQIDI